MLNKFYTLRLTNIYKLIYHQLLLAKLYILDKMTLY